MASYVSYKEYFPSIKTFSCLCRPACTALLNQNMCWQWANRHRPEGRLFRDFTLSCPDLLFRMQYKLDLSISFVALPVDTIARKLHSGPWAYRWYCQTAQICLPRKWPSYGGHENHVARLRFVECGDHDTRFHLLGPSWRCPSLRKGSISLYVELRRYTFF